MRTIISFLDDCSGATSIEYAVIASLVAAVIVAAVSQLGSAVKSDFTLVNVALK
jgi:pilus assembly protein Flp/PilA